MSLKYHDTVIEGGIHIPHNFKYANLAARKVATAFEARHLNCLALQESDGSIWRLVQIDPCIKWEQIAGEDETQENSTWYVDPINGDDDTGDGSIDFPFASFACLEKLPYHIKHEIKIKPAAGSYDYWPREIDHKWSGDGRLIIDASGETFPVAAGPYTITAASGVGSAGPWGPSLATDLTVAGTPWSTDQHYGKFIHVLTGPWAGYILPIFKNTNNTLRTGADWYSFGTGDTLNIVDCPVQIAVDHRIYFKGASVRLRIAAMADESPLNPFLLMCGVKLSVDAGINPIHFENIIGALSFCTLQDVWNTDQWSIPVELIDSSINYRDIVAHSFEIDVLNDYYAFAFQVLAMDGAPPVAYGSDILVNNSELACVSCRRRVYFIGGSDLLYALIGAAAVLGEAATTITLAYVFIEQSGFSLSCVESWNSLYIISAWIEAGGQPIDLREGRIDSAWLKGNTASTQYALKIKGGAFYEIIGANTTLLGSIGAVHFVFENVKYATWPTVGNYYTDNGGARVIRSS